MDASALNSAGIPQPGDRIAGRYVVERTLGAGGFGCVVAAEHVMLRTKVAIKVLLPQAAKLPGATERFLREAQSAAALKSEHVVRVTDMGTLENGDPFLVMEYLTGQDLRQLIRERGALPIEEAADCLLQVCDAILEAHARGIIHRDLKPPNIFVTSKANGAKLFKVLDFGLAKVLDPARSDSPEESITDTGMVVGSPSYMSPEMFRSLRNAGVRSDIWALGVIAYELFTGRRPFVGEGMAGIMTSVITTEAEPPTSLRPDLPASLNFLVMQCLKKQPELRPSWVADLIAVLEPFAPLPARATLASIHLEAADSIATPARPEPPRSPAANASPTVSEVKTNPIVKAAPDRPAPLPPAFGLPATAPLGHAPVVPSPALQQVPPPVRQAAPMPSPALMPSPAPPVARTEDSAVRSAADDVTVLPPRSEAYSSTTGFNAVSAQAIPVGAPSQPYGEDPKRTKLSFAAAQTSSRRNQALVASAGVLIAVAALGAGALSVLSSGPSSDSNAALAAPPSSIKEGPAPAALPAAPQPSAALSAPPPAPQSATAQSPDPPAVATSLQSAAVPSSDPPTAIGAEAPPEKPVAAEPSGSPATAKASVPEPSSASAVTQATTSKAASSNPAKPPVQAPKKPQNPYEQF